MRHSFAPFGPREAMFLSQRTGIDFTDADFTSDRWLCVAGYEGDQLLGLCCFEFKTWFDAWFSIAVDDPRCISRRVMAAMFKAVFSRAVRVTAEVRDTDMTAVAKAKRMGFEIEGHKRLAIEGRWDALQLGMVEGTCRFLRRAPRRSQGPHSEDYDGQFTEAA
jgi:hypothetical protein